jgi:hypothetical protein
VRALQQRRAAQPNGRALIGNAGAAGCNSLPYSEGDLREIARAGYADAAGTDHDQQGGTLSTPSCRGARRRKCFRLVARKSAPVDRHQRLVAYWVWITQKCDTFARHVAAVTAPAVAPIDRLPLPFASWQEGGKGGAPSGSYLTFGTASPLPNLLIWLSVVGIGMSDFHH